VLEKLKNKITKTFQLVYKNVETSENQQKNICDRDINSSGKKLFYPFSFYAMKEIV